MRRPLKLRGPGRGLLVLAGILAACAAQAAPGAEPSPTVAAAAPASAPAAPAATSTPSAAASAAPAARPATPPSITVAVLDYEAAAPGNPELGSQIAQVLTARLSVEDGLDLVERAKLDQVMREQHLKLVGLADQEQAAAVGKLLGAKLLVMGKTFLMDGKLMIVTKVVGVETGLVKGTLRSVEQSKPLSDAIGSVADDVAAVIRKDAAKLLPADARLDDPIARIKADLGDRPRPSVAVIIPETHVARVVVDPAVETEIKHVLAECGFKVMDTGRNSLADWAKGMMHEQKGPWPPAIGDADIVIVGEAFSEFALRTGELVTCTARAEINVIDRRTGEILWADRETSRAVDLNELTSGKTALQKAGRRLALEVCRRLAAVKPAPAATPRAGSADAGRASDRQMRIFSAPAEAKSAAPAASATKSAKRTIFAAPFENETGQEQYDPAAVGMADLVAVLLAEQPGIAVVERQRLDALTDEQARSLKGLTGEARAIAAGKLLAADTVLAGRLFLIDGKMTVSAKAIDIPSARVAASDQCSCRPEDIPESSLQLARSLAKQMSLPLPEIDLKAIDKSPLASLHFAKALSHYYAGNLDEALMQLMRTIDLDPDMTESLYWSGQCYWKLGEATHAVIDLEKYLKEQPKGRYAADASKLLEVARERAAGETAPRLGPDTPAATTPTAKAPGKAAPPKSAGTPTAGPPVPAKSAPEQDRARSQSRLQLAEMFEKAGKTDAALKEYARVIEEFPGTEFAEKARARIDAIKAPSPAAPAATPAP